jgi:hypothetical protein
MSRSLFYSVGQNALILFRDLRGSKVPKEILGLLQLMLILVTACYRGYLPLLVERQLCFVHLLRDVKKVKLEFPDELEVSNFCNDLMPLISAAIKLRKTHPDRNQYLIKAEQIQSQIMNICNQSACHPGIQYIQDIFRINEKDLFQWVKNPDIPCENNFAERHLRPVVISRKLSFGCQSERGMNTREVLMSILHTAECRGHDPVKLLEKLLNTNSLSIIDHPVKKANDLIVSGELLHSTRASHNESSNSSMLSQKRFDVYFSRIDAPRG